MPINPFIYGNPQGVGQQTAVGQIIASKTSGANGGRRSAAKRRAKSKAKSAPRKRRASSAKRPRMVKGSKAAKAYMAKIRRKRK